MAYSFTFDDHDAEQHERLTIEKLRDAGENLDNIDSTTQNMNDGGANAEWKGADYDAYENSSDVITGEGREGITTFQDYLKGIQSARRDFSTMMETIKAACGNGDDGEE